MTVSLYLHTDYILFCTSLCEYKERKTGREMDISQSIPVQHNQHYSRKGEKNRCINTGESVRIYAEGDIGRASNAFTWQTRKEGHSGKSKHFGEAGWLDVSVRVVEHGADQVDSQKVSNRLRGVDYDLEKIIS